MKNEKIEKIEVWGILVYTDNDLLAYKCNSFLHALQFAEKLARAHFKAGINCIPVSTFRAVFTPVKAP